MKIIFSFLVAGVLIAGFSSCQREVEDTLPDPDSNDSVFSRIIVLDTTFATGSDTVFTAVFNYDASGRLSNYYVVDYNVGVSGPGRFNSDKDVTRLYTGTATLPSRITTKYTDFGVPGADYDTSFLFYTDGYISKDSFTSSGFYVTRLFTKLSNTRYGMLYKMDNGAGGQSIDTNYVFVNWQNGNLIKEIDSLWLNPGGPWIVHSTTITYDNKINPAKEFSLPYPAPFYQNLPQVGIPDLVVASTNNETSEISDTGGGGITTTYEYGPTGLPKISREGSWKSFFIYKML